MKNILRIILGLFFLTVIQAAMATSDSTVISQSNGLNSTNKQCTVKRDNDSSHYTTVDIQDSHSAVCPSDSVLVGIYVQNKDMGSYHVTKNRTLYCAPLIINCNNEVANNSGA